MKVILLLMVSLFIVSCASHTIDRDVASQDDQEQVKKTKKFQPYRGIWDHR